MANLQSLFHSAFKPHKVSFQQSTDAVNKKMLDTINKCCRIDHLPATKEMLKLYESKYGPCSTFRRYMLDVEFALNHPLDLQKFKALCNQQK